MCYPDRTPLEWWDDCTLGTQCVRDNSLQAKNLLPTSFMSAFASSTISVLVRVHFSPTLFCSTLCYFSNTGTRGATSAEYFLKSGYAVIFMHRQFSLQPFSRHYSHSTNPFLDFLDIEPTSSAPPTPNLYSDSNVDGDVASGIDITSQISVTPSKRPNLLRVLATYKRVHELGLLHTLTFVTVNDYLWLLRAVSQELAVVKRKSMFYLAAAVSDFFLPRQKMVSSLPIQNASTKNLALNSPNIKSNPGRAASSSRWTKYQKYSNQWWMNGRQEVTSFLLRCFHVLVHHEKI